MGGSEKMKRIERSCKNCGKNFYARGGMEYCSLNCADGNEPVVRKGKQPFVMECIYCGVLFETFFENVCCSADCKAKYKKEKNEFGRRLRIEGYMTKICPNCGDSFQAEVYGSGESRKTYCSSRCATDFSKEKNSRNRFIIFARDNFTCIYCGKSSVENDVPLAIDHIVARKNGGTDVAVNLVTSCQECNSSKKDNPLSEENLYFVKDEVSKRNKNAGIGNLQIIRTDLGDYNVEEYIEDEKYSD
jgi:hypothetical protein